MKELRFEGFEGYSVIVLHRNDMYEYYLSKDGYGNLYFLLGIQESDITYEYDDENADYFLALDEQIPLIEEEGFWRE